ncbi:glypican-5 [Palaemon carinicauda]|uniref:glypican-5 n=1 Tax=Palaemon carinicauda TaxID=392227 RepID=UPI0035B5DF6D
MWVRWCFAVVLFISGGWHSGAQANLSHADDPIGCSPALQFLVQHNIANQEHLAQLPSNGTVICGGGACCVPQITEVLRVAGRASLSDMVRNAADTLHTALTSHQDAFNRVVEEALTNSEHRAVKEFQNTYPRLASAAKQVLHELYSGLRSGLTDFEDEKALDRVLESFWDNLFPPVYHSALHARMPPFSKAYTECLRDAQRVVQPWGIIPTLVGEPLLRGLQSARLLLHALDVGANVVNAARNLPVPQECGEAAARLHYCGACHGALAPPCIGLCLNVARGCLAPLAEVDGAWSDLAGAVGRVQESLEAMRLSHLLHQLPEKLSEAVMVALERGPKLQKKVRRDCHVPTHQDPVTTTTTTSAQDNYHHHSSQDELQIVEERSASNMLDTAAAAVRAVDTARGWWAGLADSHCKNFDTQDNSQCWNGVRIAPYTKMTAGVGVSAQKYNPEVRIGRPDTSVYTLADKLRRVRRELLSRLTWLPEAHSQHRNSYPYPDGSGSGTQAEYARGYDGPAFDEDSSVYGTLGDDDDALGSGGGSGDDIPQEDIPKKSITGQQSEIAGSTQYKSSIVLVMSIFSCVMYMYLG